MLIVVADDFSGAAEMGGIAYRFGLRAEVQMDFNLNSNADIIILDTHSRSMALQDAIKKTRSIAESLKNWDKSWLLFKKVDSVVRGYIAAEIEMLKKILGYERILLLPANPVRGRSIKSGQYYIDGVGLDKTTFAEDPEFPIRSSDMKTILDAGSYQLHHTHISPGQKISPGLTTGDVELKSDFGKYLEQMTEKDLCCGAAECFEALLEKQGYKTKSTNSGVPIKPFTLILNGSTVKIKDEKILFNKMKIHPLSLPGEWNGDQFVLEKADEEKWQLAVLNALISKSIVSVSIDLPVKRVKGIAEIFGKHYNALLRYISSHLNITDIHLGLTGGATASAVIRELGITHWAVAREIESGVVTLTRSGQLITVKPGSYHWPESFLSPTIP